MLQLFLVSCCHRVYANLQLDFVSKIDFYPGFLALLRLVEEDPVLHDPNSKAEDICFLFREKEDLFMNSFACIYLPLMDVSYLNTLTPHVNQLQV